MSSSVADLERTFYTAQSGLSLTQASKLSIADLKVQYGIADNPATDAAGASYTDSIADGGTP